MSQIKKIFYIILFPCIINAQGIIVGDSVSNGIVYNNIRDTVIMVVPNGTKIFNVDLESDNVNDISFHISQNYSPGHTWENQSIHSLNGVQFVTLLSPTDYLDTLALNSNVNTNLNWYSTTDSINLFNYSDIGGNIIITGIFMRQNNYLGFRKISAIDTIYGWILLDASLNNGIKIRSWAYQNKLSGIYESVKQNKFLIYPNPTTNLLSISDSNNNFEHGEIEIINYLSQTLLIQSYSKTMDVSQLSAGIYTMKISIAGKKSFYSKFIKE